MWLAASGRLGFWKFVGDSAPDILAAPWGVPATERLTKRVRPSRRIDGLGGLLPLLATNLW